MWLPVPGYDGYEVSEFGDVRSLDRQARHWRGGMVKRKGKTLKPIGNKGYLFVKLSESGKIRTIGVHQVVAMAFIGEPNGLVVNHKNGNKLDNRVENLEYLTNSENVLHAYATGLIDNRGENNGRAYLTDKIVREIKKSDKSESDSDVAMRLCVPVHRVSVIRNGIQWIHLT